MPNINFGLRDDGKTVGDDSNAHIMSIAPTGAGKGQTSILPNLLKWPASVFVIDPKGENAQLTYRQRRKLNDAVYVLDPFGVSGASSAAFNPLDGLDEDRPDLAEDAALLPQYPCRWQPVDFH